MTQTERQIAQSVYAELRLDGLRIGESVVKDNQEKIIDTKGYNVSIPIEGDELMELITNNLNVLRYANRV